MTFPQVRKSGEGIVATFSENAADNVTKIVLTLYLILIGGTMLALGGIQGAAALVTAILVFGYYHHLALSKFGGVTGDLAGYFLQICELALLGASVLGVWIW